MGRPKKEESEENVLETPNIRLKTKIVSYADYLQKARELLQVGPIEGMNDVTNVAVSLLYQENKVVDVIIIKGETRFICEVVI